MTYSPIDSGVLNGSIADASLYAVLLMSVCVVLNLSQCIGEYVDEVLCVTFEATSSIWQHISAKDTVCFSFAISFFAVTFVVDELVNILFAGGLLCSARGLLLVAVADRNVLDCELLPCGGERPGHPFGGFHRNRLESVGRFSLPM